MQNIKMGTMLKPLLSMIKLSRWIPETWRPILTEEVQKGNTGDLKGAVVDYTKAIELKPEYIKAYYYRASIKYQQKEFKGAIEDFSIVIELNPDFKIAYLNRGMAKYYSNDKVGACVDWQLAADLGYTKAAEKVKRYCGK